MPRRVGGQPAAAAPEPLLHHKPFPNRKSHIIDDPILWVEDKVKVDNVVGGLWRIHGKAYDFTSFAAKHPGGKHWIELTKGLDITDLFEVHHLNIEKASAILPKYYVKDDAVSTCCYTWAPGDFYSTLRSRLQPLIPRHGPTTQFLVICFATLALWTFFWLTAIFRGSFLHAFAAGLMMHALMGIGHNFFHNVDNLWTNVFDFCGFSHAIWRISHAISHHTYPNTETDFEASTIEPFVNFMTNKPRNSWLVFIYMHPFMALASTIDFFSRSILIFRARFPLTLNHFFPIIAWLPCVLVNGVAKGTILTLTMQGTASYLLLALSFLVHRTKYSWTAGDPSFHNMQSFGHHIIATSADHSLSLPLVLSLWFFGLFNNHVIHHLFPGVDQSRLRDRAVRRAFLDTVKEFKIDYSVCHFPLLASSSVFGSWRQGWIKDDGQNCPSANST